MRSYSSLLVFETLFDSVQPGNTDFDSLARQIFHPQLRVVEHDCGTRLGETVDVNFEAEGRIELATGLPISRDRIVELLSQGVYTVQTRTLSTCISEEGVCAECYAASRPLEPVPAIDSVVTIDPMHDRGTEVLYASGASGTFTLGTDADSYDHLLLFVNGQIQDPASYSVDGTTLRLVQSVPAGTNMVARFITETRAPFMLWLAGTYSGSLLGVKALPGPMLPIRSLLLRQLIPDGLVDLLIESTKKMSSVPPSMVEYVDRTEDRLERALFLIALRVIYSNV